MQQGISIPVPCHEEWQAMQPDGNGRHCAQCNQTVIDFTSWTPEAIAAYLEARRYTPVCGRFHTGQLAIVTMEPAAYISGLEHSGLPVIRKIAAIVVFIFILAPQAGAQQRQLPPAKQEVLMGAPAAVQQDRPRQAGGKTAASDKPAKASPVVMGRIALPPKKDSLPAGSKQAGRSRPGKKR